MRLNLGCGDKRMPGWRNVDKVAMCNPDEVVDLERLPWPWPDDSVDEILLSHVLEHIGQTPDVYLGIIKEIYRVCRNDATVTIVVPHPRHDHFLRSDPCAVATPESLNMFSQAANRRLIAVEAPTRRSASISASIWRCNRRSSIWTTCGLAACNVARSPRRIPACPEDVFQRHQPNHDRDEGDQAGRPAGIIELSGPDRRYPAAPHRSAAAAPARRRSSGRPRACRQRAAPGPGFSAASAPAAGRRRGTRWR